MKYQSVKKCLAILFSVLLCVLPMQLVVTAGSTDNRTFKNVIFMIGDGMGENHLKLAVQEGYTLFMEDNADNRGQSETRSMQKVTDSAAGATALSCGVRTTNSQLGTYALDPAGVFLRPRSITEQAIEQGMKTGIVTTDSTAGATPAGYSVHVSNRNMDREITEQQLDSDIDLIWGAATDKTDRDAVTEKGLTYISTKSEMEALTPGERSFGQFSWDTWRTTIPEGDESPTLVEMTEKAIELLDNDNGFFLMVEGAHIDKNSHRTENGVDFPEKRSDAAESVKGFDNAIRAAVEYAREDGETLVVVTADHETGSLYLDDGEYRYHSGSHSNANVPVLVYCCDDLIPQGEAVPNKSLPKRVAEKLGWSRSVFPQSDSGTFLRWLTDLFKKH